MTRFARGGSGNQKRPMEASSWNELKAKRERKDQDKEVSQQLHTKTLLKQNKEHSETVYEACNTDRNTSRPENMNYSMDGSTRNKESKQSKGKMLNSAKRAEYLTVALHKEQRSEKRRLKRVERRETEMVCYNCRKSGHNMSDCPDIRRDMEQGTGICFKCGSTEHTSAKCSVKVPKGHYPYAKCFVCGETGHLSKQCPDNPRGLYPMGGCCKICQSVEHYQRDCPQLKEQQGIGGYRLQTLKSLDNPDAELFDDTPIPKTVKKTGPKIVKF